MAVQKYFTPVLKWLSVVADEPADDDANPETKGIYAGVTVTPILDSGASAIRVPTLTGGAAILAIASFEARLDDGVLKLTATQRLRLLANCPLLELPEPTSLSYLFHFHHVRYNGAERDLPDIRVAAPFVDEDHNDDLGGEGANEVVLNLATAPWLNAA